MHASRAYGAFTLESILAAGFGRVIDVQRGDADEVTRAAKAVFDDRRGKLLLVAVFFTCRLIVEHVSIRASSVALLIMSVAVN